jgi:microcystin-dependent protein
MAGTEFSTLTEANLPRHNHALLAQRKAAAFQDPTENMLAMGVTHSGHETIAWNTYVPGPTTIPISNLAIGISGGNQAHENRQPVQVLNYCIATQGLFPPQP